MACHTLSVEEAKRQGKRNYIPLSPVDIPFKNAGRIQIHTPYNSSEISNDLPQFLIFSSCVGRERA